VPALAIVKELELRFGFGYSPKEFAATLARVARSPEGSGTADHEHRRCRGRHRRDRRAAHRRPNQSPHRALARWSPHTEEEIRETVNDDPHQSQPLCASRPLLGSISRLGSTCPRGQGPFPAVVMGHGLGAVKVGGLASFAERFCREGFCPRSSSTTASGVAPRGSCPADELSVPRQREGLHRRDRVGRKAQPDIDEHRIFVWGTSFAGMHATALAASDHRPRRRDSPNAPWLTVSPVHAWCVPAVPLRYFATAIIDRLGSPRRPRADLSARQRGSGRNGASPTHQMHCSARKSCTRASRSTGTTGWRRGHC